MARLTLLQGGAGKDMLTCPANADNLSRDACNDRMNGGGGAEVLTPGSGTKQARRGKPT